MDLALEARLGYLSVDRFAVDVAGARALGAAFELGLIDWLMEASPRALSELGALARLDERGTRLLAGLLRVNGVIDISHDRVRLTEAFAAALRYRDLLEAKLDFAALVAPDFLGLFTTLLADPGRFFGEARLFELFSYDRCFDPTPENRANTARWMRFTTALTKYESGPCLDAYDFSRHRRMLDVGGNSGEFGLRACRRHPELRVTVHDLPVVCEIGESHVGSEPEAARISFASVSHEGGAFPAGCDLVTFKSMLHDWPEDQVRAFLVRAYEALPAGGTVLIYERGPVEIGDAPLPYSQIPLVLFFRSYRGIADYTVFLQEAGFRDVSSQLIDLDMPFLLVTANK